MIRKISPKIIYLLIAFSILANAALAESKKEKKENEAKNAKKYVHPCAPGTEQFGEGPPSSTKVVCRQPLGRGKFRAEGKLTAWHANGKKKVEGDYVRGDKHGVWTTYHRNGRIKFVETYYSGKMQTKTKFDRYGRPVKPSAQELASNQQNNNQEKKKKRLSWRFMRNK